MNLLEAFKSAVSGQEDKAGIDMVDVYLANTKDDSNHPKEKKITEFKDVISAEIGDEEHKWFLLYEAITEWNLVDDFIADDIRQVLSNKSKNINPHTHYHMLRVIGYASGGLIPNDILNEECLKKSAPNFWLELLLVAYQNGNPNTITDHIISLVEGQNPLLTREALHDLLPEVRRAYDSVPQFRNHINIIAHSMDSVADRQNILNAVEKIVGGGLDSMVEPSNIDAILPEVRRTYASIPRFRNHINIIAHSMDSVPDFYIPKHIIEIDKTYNNCKILPVA